MFDDHYKIIATVKIGGKIRWFRSDRDLWVLNVNAWRDAALALGYDVPEFNEKFRGGIHCVNSDNAHQFLNEMRKHEVSAATLQSELLSRLQPGSTFWNLYDLFPIVFVDFDRQHVAGFYHDDTPMERFIAHGWQGEFTDFAMDFSEEIFPENEKFWVYQGQDILARLIEHGQAA